MRNNDFVLTLGVDTIQREIEGRYEQRENNRKGISIAIYDPADPPPPGAQMDIRIPDAALAQEIAKIDQTKGLRLSLTLPLSRQVQGNPNSICPCSLKP
jgi:hypothetical protein